MTQISIDNTCIKMVVYEKGDGNLFAALFVAGSYAVALIVIIVTVSIALGARKRRLENMDNNISSVSVIDETPIIRRQAENTGYTVSYGRRISSHEHYRYRNVVTGHIVTFKVVWRNGKEEIIKCKKDDVFYKRLINKTIPHT